MDNISNDCERYLRETLDIEVNFKQWSTAEKLPIFLRDMYVFLESRILGTPCLVMAVKDKTEQTPATVRKHILQVRKKWQDEVVYLQQKMTAYNRKRFIQSKIPFIVPLNQMYLPFLGIDLREYFKNIRNTEARFSPSTQVVVLYYLSQNGRLRMTPKRLAQELGYSMMTMTRALDELEGAGLGTITMEGRERVLRFNRDKKLVWETALARLRSPVKKRMWVKNLSIRSPGMRAGLSALASYSPLAEPANPVLAMKGIQWKRIKDSKDIMILDIAEPDASELEIWWYSPELFGEKRVVDRFSLYLSMREDNDERVQSALAAMMEEVKW